MTLTAKQVEAGGRRMVPQTCPCGCQQFRVSRPDLDKEMLSVRCAICGAFYGYLIPDFGMRGRWRLVYQN
jgi:hypothetical protein